MWNAHFCAPVWMSNARMSPGADGSPSGTTEPEDQQVAEEHAGRVDADAERVRVAPPEALAQIDAALLPNPASGLPVVASSAYSQ